jgi:hypothetical protein
VNAPTKVMVTVLVKPVSMGRLTRWKVSCDDCKLRSIPIAQKDMAEKIAYQHARDKHLGSARVAVRQR